MALTEEKNRQILDAAVAEFQELGFSGASMDRIAARAQVSKRTVYNHFANKEALFRAILDLMAGQASPALDIAYDPARPIEVQLRDLGWGEGKLLTSPVFMRLARIVVGEIIRDPVLAAEMNARMDAMDIFRRFMQAAAEDGTLAVRDPEAAAEQFLGLIKARAFWPVVFSGEIVSEDEMGRIVDESVAMILNTYARREAG
ncbi:MAG: TetR/AcrR family transcriptional regulator [Pseudomonadota bacterium]